MIANCSLHLIVAISAAAISEAFSHIATSVLLLLTSAGRAGKSEFPSRLLSISEILGSITIKFLADFMKLFVLLDKVVLPITTIFSGIKLSNIF